MVILSTMTLFLYFLKVLSYLVLENKKLSWSKVGAKKGTPDAPCSHGLGNWVVSCRLELTGAPTAAAAAADLTAMSGGKWLLLI